MMMTTEFDELFEQLEAPEYPATCDQCGVEGTNQTMAGHVCQPQAERALGVHTPDEPRLDFHIAEDLIPTNRRSACLLIEEESGLTVAEFPNSDRGIGNCQEAIRRWNNHAQLVVTLEQVRTWLTAPATDKDTLNEMYQTVSNAISRVRE